jgi:hypothetical protein
MVGYRGDVNARRLAMRWIFDSVVRLSLKLVIAGPITSREEMGNCDENSDKVVRGSRFGSNGIVRIVDTVPSRHLIKISGDDSRNVMKGNVTRDINKGKQQDDLDVIGWKRSINVMTVGA